MSAPKQKVPPWMTRVSEDTEAARFAAMTPDERLAHFVEACGLAQAILQHRPDASEVLARRDPRSPEAEATWRRLVSEARNARAT